MNLQCRRESVVMPSGFRAGVSARIREVETKFVNREAAANAAGVSLSTFQRWATGQSDPSFEGMTRLCEAAGVSLEWVATGDDQLLGSAAGGLGEEPAPYRSGDQLGDEFVLIRRLAVEASAGPGALATSEDVLDHMAFREDWLRSAIGTDPRNLVLITAVGDSMEPAIRAGDLLLIDRSTTRFAGDALYVVVRFGDVSVKRLQRDDEGDLRLLSDNPAYPPVTIRADDPGDFRIAGRVRWIARIT